MRFTPFLFLLPGVVSWGLLGHQTVALIAQFYLLPKTVTERNEPGGGFTFGYHFVNGQDRPPPDSCKIEYPKDCPPEGCIVSAIANYTERLMDKKLERESRAEALRFLIHFVGDITQPRNFSLPPTVLSPMSQQLRKKVHTEAFGAGANSILVYFAGKPTNLHAAWDTSIPNKIINTTSPTTLESLGWANAIASLINVGPYKRRLGSWVHDLDTEGNGPENSAAKWAVDSNELVCEYAIDVAPEEINGTEIAGEYYDGAVPIVIEQIAKGGVRLAGWLNLIFEGKTGF
ncbi:phospholipase C/P1 nuclease [Tuber magnatum]|uniref:Phospholipase C/P1 nuclease n=1 Tax=Tuber magnatum TaxID=42249 RepID=A0A317SZK1_9PEZI|nr:phospholipase C/P1 nuclease [Tuber magnatum]